MTKYKLTTDFLHYPVGHIFEANRWGEIYYQQYGHGCTVDALTVLILTTLGILEATQCPDSCFEGDTRTTWCNSHKKEESKSECCEKCKNPHSDLVEGCIENGNHPCHKKEVKEEKECNETCCQTNDIAIQHNSHDITLVDIKHHDNSITMTRFETKEVMKKLNEILSPTPSDWRPKMENYYYINSGGQVVIEYWDNRDSDKYRLATKNVFKTREEAEERLREIKSLIK